MSSFTKTAFRRAVLAAALVASVVAAPIGASAAFAADATFPPTAVEDNYTVVQGTQLVVNAANGILANDQDGGNSDLAMNGASTNVDGNLIWAFDGSFTFIPVPGFSGAVHFDYRDLAGGMYSNYAAITIVVTAAPPPAYDAPTAVADHYTMVQGTTMVAAPALTFNDTTPQGVKRLNDVYNATPGELSLLGDVGAFTYTPDPTFTGTRTFEYDIVDDVSNLVSNKATVTIEIIAAPDNTAPIAVADNYTTTQGVPLHVDASAGLLANDSDPEGDSFTVIGVRNAHISEIVLDVDGTLTYTTDPGFVGTRTFEYHTIDANLVSNWALVTITVTAPTSVPDPTDSDPTADSDPADTATPTDDDGTPTLPDTGSNISTWDVAPAIALLALGVVCLAFGRRRRLTP